jgi:hypothetical protein
LLAADSLLFRCYIRDAIRVFAICAMQRVKICYSR